MIGRTNEKGDSEEAFFQVLSCADFWKEFKKYMFPNKRKSDFYNYKDGDIAAHHGYFDLIKGNSKLIFNKAIGPSGIDSAAANGRFDILQYIFFNKTTYCTHLAIDYAAAYGYLEIVKFLHENTSKGYTIFAINQAAANGHLDVIIYLYNNRRKSKIIESIETRNELHLKDKRHLCCDGNKINGNYALNIAVHKGYLDIVKFLMQNRCADGSIFGSSYYPEGSLKFKNRKSLAAYEFIPYNEEERVNIMLLTASQYGHLEIIKFLYPYVEDDGIVRDIIRKAIKKGKQDIIDFLLEQETIDFDYVIVDAISALDFVTVGYIYNNYDIDVEGILGEAILESNHKIQQFLINLMIADNTIQMTIENAKKKGHYGVVTLLSPYQKNPHRLSY